MDYMEYSSICSDDYASIREVRYAPRIYSNVYTAAHIIRAEIVEYLCDTFNNGIRKCLGSVKISPYIHKDNDAAPYRAYSVTIKVNTAWWDINSPYEDYTNAGDIYCKDTTYNTRIDIYREAGKLVMDAYNNRSESLKGLTISN
jgi:hypothetical protein